MNYLTVIMATTHVNRQFERSTREEFEGAATQPEGVLCHGADYKLRVLEMLDRAEMYLYRRDGETVIQVEEIHSTPIIRPFDGEQFAVEAFGVSMFDEEKVS